MMNSNQALLRHFLAALAYRTAKALRDAPAGFETFHAGQQARTPRELVRHMSGVINDAIGSPIAPEDFFEAAIHPDRLGADQAAPRSPDRDWPEAPDDWNQC